MARTTPIPPELSAVRAQAGRIGAHVQWSREADPTARTAKARAAFLDRFEREVDPEGRLDPAERARRAAHARRAYFARLALKSSMARARKREGGGDAT